MPSIRNSLFLLGATAALAAKTKRANDEYAQRAINTYNKVTNNGKYNSKYFSSQKFPYHSIETLMIEAPDQGHESVSETFSFWIWMEAVNGKLTGNYKGVEAAWNTLEKIMIPNSSNQPGMSKYNPSSPATYAPEDDDITNYPAQLVFDNGLVGQDPIAQELQQAYGTWDIYAMHWIIDGDNWYGYGQKGDGSSKPSFINTFQRGASESAWKTVPHPCWETFKWGGPNGFLDLFTKDNGYSKQWRYTAAPDADARAIQAAYFAYIWAQEDGKNLSSLAAKAAKLGDYLRYSHYDKYFKQIGNCYDYRSCPAGSGKSSAHYLISWYFSWGGGLQGDWSWRIGSSHTHTGYQSPLAAWILSTQAAFKPKGRTAVEDWEISMDRQLELIRWLQAAEGCIAGGATNSWQGHYAQPPNEDINFYGMWYDWQPVYHDPPSNDWTGMQGWGMERVCSLYYLSGNEKAGKICQVWAQWVKDNVRVTNGEIIHATTFDWSGDPDNWDSSNFFEDGGNQNLHGSVREEGIDIGSVASIIKGLLWVSMKDNDQEGINLVFDVMDALENYKDDLGYTVDEVREDYSKFNAEVYIPQGWTGKNAQGAQLRNGVTFLDIRPKYKQDPEWSKVEEFLNGGSPPHFTYHRFWGQTEIMVANGLLSIYDVQRSGSSGGSGGSSGNSGRTNCSQSIRNQGYKCCRNGCKVTYTDSDGDWSDEDGEWCGCGKSTSSGGGSSSGKCSQAIINQGYKCCSNANCEVIYVDESGNWGAENGEWCGCGGSQSSGNSKCSSAFTSQGYPCCSSCSQVYYTDGSGKWGVENGDWCGLPSNC